MSKTVYVYNVFNVKITWHLQMTLDGTLADTCMLLSCMVMMASEILMSTGSITASMLKGPSSLSATSNIASVTTQEDTCQLRDIKHT